MASRPKADPDYYIKNNDPELLNARVFIGNLPTNQMRKEDLEDRFKKHGKLLAVSMLKGFGFVQFEKESDARRAVSAEKGLVLKGYETDIKMAAEGRKKERDRDRDRYDDRRMPPGNDRPPMNSTPRMPPGRERSPMNAGPRAPPGRERSPPNKGSRMPPGRDRSPLGDRRDPYRRDSSEDSFRRPPNDRDDWDRYPGGRGDRFPPRRDPYNEPPPPPPPFIPPFDCTIVTMTKDQRDYAEIVERRIKGAGLETDFIILSNEAMLAKAMDDITLQKIPFAVVCSAQNETHRSLTVNILHGTPQEHRNMPLDDAITLIGKNFEKFKEEIRAKMAPPGPAGRTKGKPADFVAPHPQLAYLMNLMADGRELTLEELDQIFTYVLTRRNREREARGLPTERVTSGEAVPAAVPVATAAPVPVPVAAPGKPPVSSDQEKTILEQQAQLQAKILSILQGPSTPAQSIPSRNPYDSPLDSLSARSPISSQPQLARALESFARRPSPSAAQSRPQQSSGGINFDNPQVQKALDNLIQSGPNLLRNINTSNEPNRSSLGQYGNMMGGGSYRY